MKAKKAFKKLDIKKLKRNEKGQYILPLEIPVPFGKETITELHLDEPKAKHLRGLSSDPGMDEILSVIALLSHQPDSVIDELSMKDTALAGEFFGSFE